MNYLDPYPQGKFPVILLHGLGADASSWQLQFDDLGKMGFRPVAVDLPGFGNTSHRGKWTITNAAEQVDMLLRQLNFELFDLVGISMGGIVAQQYVHEHINKVRKLVLVNTFACLRPRRVGQWLYLLRRFLIANLRGVEYQAQLVAWRLFPNEDQGYLRDEIIARILASDQKVYRAAMVQLGKYDSRNWLRKITCPTLIISGEKDTTVPMENQAELVNGISGSKQVIIKEARHAVIADHPQEFNQALLEFLLEKTNTE